MDVFRTQDKLVTFSNTNRKSQTVTFETQNNMNLQTRLGREKLTFKLERGLYGHVSRTSIHLKHSLKMDFVVKKSWAILPFPGFSYQNVKFSPPQKKVYAADLEKL